MNDQAPVPPPVPEPEIVGFPAIEQTTISRGLRAFVLPRRDLPLVVLHLVLRAGSDRDPAGKEGIAAFTAEMLEAGAGSMDYQEIARRVDLLGVRMSIGTTVDGTIMTFTFLSEALSGVLSILGEILTAPTFPEDELERRRTRRIHHLLQQRDRPAALANRAFARALYGACHPYGTESPGSEESLTGIQREEVVAFAARNFGPGEAYLIATGDLDMDTLVRVGEQVFSGWSARPASPDPVFPTPAGTPGTVLVIHRPGAAQAEIRVGRPALARTENGVFPAIVLNRVFGGQFTSRLNAVLREKKGLTYGIHSTFSFNRMPGPFSIATSVDSDRAADAIEMLDGELAKVAAGGISSGELSLAQRGIAGGFALALEHLAQIASIIDLIVLHDLPIDYYAKYLSRIRAVTLADVAECARRLMDPGRMTTVVVGDTDALRKAASPSLRSRLRDISAEDQADSGRLPEERGA